MIQGCLFGSFSALWTILALQLDARYHLSAEIAGLIVGVILLDFAEQGALVSNQNVIYALRPEARNRLNTVIKGGMFVGGAVGSAGASLAWELAGCAAVGAFGAALVATTLGPHARCRGPHGDLQQSKAGWWRTRRRPTIGAWGSRRGSCASASRPRCAGSVAFWPATSGKPVRSEASWPLRRLIRLSILSPDCVCRATSGD
jgi:hypothetical protein